MIINICRGGLGNRLKPLSSCFALAKKTGRTLGINWSVDAQCHVRFDELYASPMETVSLQWLQERRKISLYADRAIMSVKWFKELLEIGEVVGIRPLAEVQGIPSDKNEVIVIYANDYLDGSTAAECREFFDWLTPGRAIRERLAAAQGKLRLDKSFIGVHARGSDFGGSMEDYLKLMNRERATNRQARFFLCSDSPEYEAGLVGSVPHTITRQKDAYVSKLDQAAAWDTDNINRSAESVREAVVDMHLLAATDFKIYNAYSSFAHVVKMMSTGELERFPVTGKQTGLLSRLKAMGRGARRLFHGITPPETRPNQSNHQP